jgi:putative transposase
VSYQVIVDHQGEYAMETMCGALGVSVSGYYAWQRREPSAREQSDEELLQQIRAIHQDSRGL